MLSPDGESTIVMDGPPAPVAAAPPGCPVDCKSSCCRATVIAARGLRVTYAGGVCALDSVAIDVAQGEHVVILGASGSGKTTLLRCLASRLAPQEGTVECRGRIATIHQDLRLVRQLSARRNILHGSLGRHSMLSTLARFPALERDRAGQFLQRVGLEHRASLRVSRLSGGEQQRVAIARALMQDPCVLLADEPVASLDEANAHHIMALLRDLCREHNLALVTVLHNPQLARQYADRIIRLDRGRIAGEYACCQPAMSGDGVLSEACEPCASIPCELQAPQLGTPRAVQIPTINSAKVPPAPAESLPSLDPTAGSIWRFAGIAAVALIVYAWAIRGLGIRGDQLADAVPGLWGFAKGLLPTSSAQLAAIPWRTLLVSLIETVQMSLIGTTVGVVIAFPLAALAARNVGPRLRQRAVRQLLNIIRTIPSLIWALIFVAAVGFGPLAGVLALTFYSLGYLTKFFYESFEAADTGPQGALSELGASGPQRFIHAVWPAALPAALSSCLFVLEYNVRAASVLGIVDAGGIGWHIKHFLDYRNFPAAIACLLMVLAVVIVLDAISTRVRAWAVQR
jgi:phosphonate ABC transporter permease subunit PhnE